MDLGAKPCRGRRWLGEHFLIHIRRRAATGLARQRVSWCQQRRLGPHFCSPPLDRYFGSTRSLVRSLVLRDVPGLQGSLPLRQTSVLCRPEQGGRQLIYLAPRSRLLSSRGSDSPADNDQINDRNR